MKSSKTRLFAWCCTFSVVVLAADAAWAQGKGGGGNPPPPPPTPNVAYNVHWVLPPAGYKDVYARDFLIRSDGAGNDTAIVVGFLEDSAESRTAFVYTYDQATSTATMTDVNQLVGGSMPAWVPATHTGSIFYGVNSSGRVVGIFENELRGERIAFYLDLTDDPPVPQQIPAPALPGPYQAGYRPRVNELGDVAVRFESTDTVIPFTRAAMYTPSTQQLVEAPFDVSGDIFFNSLQQIVTKRTDGVVVRHTFGGLTQSFANLFEPIGLNDAGQFVAGINGLPKKKGKTRGVARIGLNGSVEWSRHELDLPGFYLSTFAHDLNSSGDVMFFDSVNHWYFNEGNPAVRGDTGEIFVSNILTLVANSPDPDNPSVDFKSTDAACRYLSDRDETGYGWFCGFSPHALPDGSYRDRMVLLIPEILP